MTALLAKSSRLRAIAMLSLILMLVGTAAAAAYWTATAQMNGAAGAASGAATSAPADTAAAPSPTFAASAAVNSAAPAVNPAAPAGTSASVLACLGGTASRSTSAVEPAYRSATTRARSAISAVSTGSADSTRSRNPSRP